VVAATLCVAVAAHAHRMPGSISTIKKNSAGDSIEIIHRLHAHDAELGLNATMTEGRVSLESLRGQAQLALYIEARFSLAGFEDGQPGSRLPLELIGAELDGEFVLVYQEFAGELPARLAIRDDILRDVFPDQINHVNLATDGAVRTVTFSDDDEWQTLLLD
jgi:hypothetical protein